MKATALVEEGKACKKPESQVPSIRSRLQGQGKSERGSFHPFSDGEEFSCPWQAPSVQAGCKSRVGPSQKIEFGQPGCLPISSLMRLEHHGTAMGIESLVDRTLSALGEKKAETVGANDVSF